MKKKSWSRTAGILIAVLLMVTAILAGCSSKEKENNSGATQTASPQATSSETEVSEKEELEPVTLNWYVAAAEVQSDLESVENAVNKILNEKINTTLKLHMFDYGSYDQKMQLKAASGEEFDLSYSSYSWLNKYIENVSKGMFIPLDELLAKYASDYYKSIPEKYWDATRVDGKIYGALNYQVYGNSKGFMVQKKLADKYGFDYSNVTSLQQVEAFLEQVKQGESGITPLGADKNGLLELLYMDKDQQEYWDYTVNGNLNVGLKIGDSTHTLKNLDDPEYKTYYEDSVRLIRDWYNKGYLRKDVASVQNVNQELAGGQYAMWPATYKPGGDAELAGKYGFEIVQFPYKKPVATAGSIMSSMTAISKTSKNPERAMMLLNLINTDTELYNLLAYGIENKHYKKNADNTVEMIEGGGYWPNIAWQYGNQFNAYLIKGMSPTVWEETKKFNEEAVVSPLVGFNPDVESLKNIIANVNAVNDEMKAGLLTGTLDPDKYLPSFYEKMKKADPEGKVKIELQKQLTEWASKK